MPDKFQEILQLFKFKKEHIFDNIQPLILLSLGTKDNKRVSINCKSD